MLNENVAQANSLLKKLNISESNPDYLKIKQMLKGHEGYVYWFTKLKFVDNQPLNDLEEIWNIINDKNGITSFFTKKIVEIESMEDFWDQYEHAKLFSLAKKVLNQFPSQQKRFFDIKNQEDLDTLIQLGKSKSLPALIKKISSFKDKKSLIEAAQRLLAASFDGKFGELIKMINDVDSDIIVADEVNNIIICQVNYKQIVELGGDTSWCIVRAESTFNAYAKGGMQWIIYLVDNFSKNDRMSKIGITTNSDYKTAHDKYDGYIDKKQITDILSERGVDIKDLYFSKETLMSMSKWDDISVEVLLSKDISKNEIIKRKNVYKGASYYRTNNSEGKGDLDFFTEEEIAKYDLHNKTMLSWSDAAKMSYDNVLKYNVLDRLSSPTYLNTVMDQFKLTPEKAIEDKIYKKTKVLIEFNSLKLFTKKQIIDNELIKYSSYMNLSYIMHEFKFTKEEVIKYKLYEPASVIIDHNTITEFTKEELINYKIIDKVSNIPFSLFLNIFTHKEIIDKYSDKLDDISTASISHFKGKSKKNIISELRYVNSTELERLSIDRDDEKSFKLSTLSIFEINSDDLPLKGTRNKLGFTDIIRRMPVKKENVLFLKTMGYDLIKNFDTIIDIFIYSDTVNLNRIADITQIREYLKDNKKFYDLCTNDIKNSLKSRIYVDLNMFEKAFNILSKAPEWEEVKKSVKEYTKTSFGNLSTKASHGSDSYSKPIDFERTKRFADLLGFTKEDIEDMGLPRFTYNFHQDKYGLTDDYINKFIEYIQTFGYEVDEKMERHIIADLLSNSMRRVDRKDDDDHAIYSEDYYIILINRDIDVEKSLKFLYDEYFSQRNSLPSYDASKYEALFNKGGEKWIEIYNKAVKKIRHKESAKETLDELKKIFNHFYRDKPSDEIKECEKWYDKYYEAYTALDNNSIFGWGKFEQDLKVLLILTRLGKYDEFDFTEWHLDERRASGLSFDDNRIHSLAKVISGVSRDYKGFFVPEENMKKLYDWVDSKVDEPWMGKYMLICYYNYDKEKYNTFMENSLKVKNNYKSKYSESETKTTLRIDLYRYILKYFNEQNDFDAFEKIVNNLFETRKSKLRATKMGNIEFKKSIKYLREEYTRRNSDFNKNVEKLVKELEDKYTIIKESFILKWNDFLN